MLSSKNKQPGGGARPPLRLPPSCPHASMHLPMPSPSLPPCGGLSGDPSPSPGPCTPYLRMDQVLSSSRPRALAQTPSSRAHWMRSRLMVRLPR